MSDDTEWLDVWEEDGSSFTVYPHNEPSIDAAVSRHIESGGIRDTLLSLDFLDGREFKVRASRIVSWAASTPATRRRAKELAQAQKEEDVRIRHELGIWEDAE